MSRGGWELSSWSQGRGIWLLPLGAVAVAWIYHQVTASADLAWREAFASLLVVSSLLLLVHYVLKGRAGTFSRQRGLTVLLVLAFAAMTFFMGALAWRPVVSYFFGNP